MSPIKEEVIRVGNWLFQVDLTKNDEGVMVWGETYTWNDIDDIKDIITVLNGMVKEIEDSKRLEVLDEPSR